MCHGLAEATNDAVQNHVDLMVVCHVGINIKSIDIVQVFLDSTCLLDVTDFIKSPVWRTVVAIVVPDSALNLFPGIIPVSICFPLV